MNPVSGRDHDVGKLDIINKYTGNEFCLCWTSVTCH